MTLPPSVSASRRVFALAALTFGGFAIGCNEFLAMGVLPHVAASLAPQSYRHDPDAAVASHSVFVWGYALGVSIGAPLLGALARRWSPRTFLTCSLAIMAFSTAGVSVVSGTALVTTLRVISGIPHAAYLGVGAIAAAGLLGSRHAARGVAAVLGGLTIASIVGAPLGTFLSQTLDWRWFYAAIAVLFGIAALCTLLTVPATARSAPRSPWQGLGERRLWASLLCFALVNSGMFAALTFTAPLATDHSNITSGAVAFLVAASGIGLTVGNYVGGYIADHDRRLAVAVAVVGSLLGLVLVAVPAIPATAFAGFALVGFALGGLSPFTQTLLMRAVPGNPALGSSMNSLSANLGSVVGGLLASIAISASGDTGAAAWAGLTLTALGWLVALSIGRHRGQSNEVTTEPRTASQEATSESEV